MAVNGDAQRIYQLIIDAGGAKAGAEMLKRAAEQISESSAKAAAAGKPLTDNVAATEKAYARLVTRIDPITTAQTRMAQEIAVVQRAFAAQKITVDQAAVNLQQIATRYDVAVDRAKKFGQGLGGASSSGKGFGTAIQQAGYQVGDFAVQVASGQGVLRPLIQQGTQLISMFGPWGAVIGAAGAVVGALATSLWDMSSASKDAAGSQEHLIDVLKDMDKIQDQLDGNAKRNRASLQAQLDYDLDQVQKAYDLVKAKADITPQTLPARGGGTRDNPLYEAVNKQLTEARVKLETARQLAGQVSDSFARMGEEAGEGSTATAKSIGAVTDAMKEQLRVLQLAKPEREADKIVDQKLADLGYTRASAGQELIKTLTDLATAQVAQTQANKDAETAQQRSVENAKAVATVLTGLKKQYDDLQKAPAETRAENLFAGKIPTQEELQRAEEWLKKIDDLKTAYASDKQNRQEIDQLIEQGTRGVEQRQKWEQTSLATQADQIDLLKLQLALTDQSDTSQQLKLAHLRAEQEVHQQLGTTMDANALKYIENADAIAKMSQQLQKQKAIAQELPQFFDQAFDRIGSAITQAMATGEIAMTNLLDVGRSIVSELIQEFIKLAALNPLKNWINGNDALPTATSLLGSLFGGGAATNSAGFRMSGAGPGASSMGGGFFSSIFSGIGSFFGFDQGGIMGPNGPIPLRKYAGGGVANTPQMAMFGEGSRPEAYVPLADGRSIPVTMQGGAGAGGGGTVINVHNEITIAGSSGTQAQNADMADQTAREVERAVADAVDRRLAYHRRTGNMLNPGMA